jgi:hypothetical protein
LCVCCEKRSTEDRNECDSFGPHRGGVLQSYGDNNIDGNADGDPAIPVILKK